ncbi:MAG TPA: response regulator [Polyangia bacterium]|nr:response regulator [Polyangia bacterium]
MLERSSTVTARGEMTAAQTRPAALLAVTDDIELRDMLLELAMEEGYGVRCVATDAEAGTVLLAERPGLVVVDLDMASGAGGKFLRLLRRSPHRAIPCMGVTATNDMMLSVSIDAPVFFKPSLTGFADALRVLFVVPTTT